MSTYFNFFLIILKSTGSFFLVTRRSFCAFDGINNDHSPKPSGESKYKAAERG